MAEYENIIDLDKLGRFHNNLKYKGLPLNNWQTNKKYKVGYTVIQDGKLYRCKTEHTSTTTFDSTKFDLVGGSGSGIQNWATNTSYSVGDLVIHDNNIYQCNTNHTSTTFTADRANWQDMKVEEMTGATSSANGTGGSVPAPTSADTTKFLCGDGTWKSVGGGEASVIKDTLWSGFETSATTLSLTHDYSEYDYIAVSVGEGRTHSVHVLLTAVGSRLDINTYYPTAEQYSYSSRIVFSGATAQLEDVIAQSSNYGIFRIEGIKFVNPNVYSTTEQRVGTWIDGKPLYQVTFIGTFGTITSTDTILQEEHVDLSSYNIDRTCEISYLRSESSGGVASIGMSFNPSTFDKRGVLLFETRVNSSDNKLYLYSEIGNWYSNAGWIVTLQYTKTTD